MARTVTLLQLRTRSLRRADMATSGFVSSSEVTDLVNDELPEVYRLLVEAGPPDYYSSTQTYALASGSSQGLPADFFHETTVYVLDTNSFTRPLLPVQDWRLSRAKAATGTATITMEYVPAPPTLANDADTFDGIAGWDSLLTCRVGRRLLQKRSNDTSNLDMEIAQLTDHLKKGARRSKDPRYSRDIEDAISLPYSPPYLALVSHYRIRAGSIEFYTPMVLP